MLGLVQLFKNAVLDFPKSGTPVRKIGTPKARRAKKAKKAGRRKGRGKKRR